MLEEIFQNYIFHYIFQKSEKNGKNYESICLFLPNNKKEKNLIIEYIEF